MTETEFTPLHSPTTGQNHLHPPLKEGKHEVARENFYLWNPNDAQQLQTPLPSLSLPLGAKQISHLDTATSPGSVHFFPGHNSLPLTEYLDSSQALDQNIHIYKFPTQLTDAPARHQEMLSLAHQKSGKSLGHSVKHNHPEKAVSSSSHGAKQRAPFKKSYENLTKSEIKFSIKNALTSRILSNSLAAAAAAHTNQSDKRALKASAGTRKSSISTQHSSIGNSHLNQPNHPISNQMNTVLNLHKAADFSFNASNEGKNLSSSCFDDFNQSNYEVGAIDGQSSIRKISVANDLLTSTSQHHQLGSQNSYVHSEKKHDLAVKQPQIEDENACIDILHSDSEQERRPALRKRKPAKAKYQILNSSSDSESEEDVASGTDARDILLLKSVQKSALSQQRIGKSLMMERKLFFLVLVAQKFRSLYFSSLERRNRYGN